APQVPVVAPMAVLSTPDAHSLGSTRSRPLTAHQQVEVSPRPAENRPNVRFSPHQWVGQARTRLPARMHPDAPSAWTFPLDGTADKTSSQTGFPTPRAMAPAFPPTALLVVRAGRHGWYQP